MGKDLKKKELGKGITQKKDGNYLARFTNRAGKRVDVKTSKKLSEVRAALQKAIYEDEMNINNVQEALRLDEWYEKWMSIHKYNTISPNTKRYYSQLYNKHISPVLGGYKLNDLTQIAIKKLIKDLAEKGLKFGTQNKVRVLLVDMLDKALIDNFVRKNVAKGIKLVRNEEKDIRVLTNEEIVEFFECSKGTFYYNFFEVALATGLRLGELAALTWDDIDLEKKEISVTKSLLYQKLEGDEKKTFHLGNTKTKSSVRKVPINMKCEEALRRQREQKRVTASRAVKEVPEEFKDLLFVTKYNTPINTQICSDAIKCIVREINSMKDELEQMENFSCHTFRHTFATMCFEANIQPKTVQKYLGHATLQMTMDLYTHVLEDYKQNEMLKLESRFEDIFGNSVEVSEAGVGSVNENNEKNNLVYFAKTN